MARILVVDDTPQNIRLIELYLRETEFEVESAKSGLEAIERAMHGAYDLILLDVVMPGIDGFEVCRRLKNDPLTAFVPVIFLTGRMGAESDKLAAYKLGAVDYIQKPVDREELVARIRVMLGLEGARSRLDRENVSLRAELARAQRRAAELEAAFADLQHVSVGQDAPPAPALVALDPGRVVLSLDAGSSDVVRALTVGAPLEGAGDVGQAIARVLDAGAPVASAVVDDGRG
ncbi:MAG: response regulator, partial [Planctomycetota bacterium]